MPLWLFVPDFGRSGGLGFGSGFRRSGQRPGLAERFKARCVVLAGCLFEGLHGRVEELVDKAARERFDRCDLLGREGIEAGVDAAELGLADFLGLALERDDGGRDVDGALTLMEAFDLSGDECFGVSGLGLALGNVGRGNLLEVVDVVDEEAVELVDLGIDVARDGDVDEEHGAVAAALQEGVAVLAAEDGVRRAGGGDDDVGFAGSLVELLEGDDAAVEGLGEGARTLQGAVGDEDGAGALLDEVTCGEFAHFTCADKEDGAALKRAEDLAGELDGDGRDGDGIGPDFGLGADLLRRGKRALEQVLKVAANCAGGTGDGEGFLDLAENLRLAHDHGIEAGGDAEEMANRVLVAVLIDVRREEIGVEIEVAMQEGGEVGVGRFEGGENLDAITGGDNHALGDAGGSGEGAGGLGQIVAGDGDALAQLDGRGLVVDADEGERHWAPNLWTWLKALAAKTASITMKTAPET